MAASTSQILATARYKRKAYKSTLVEMKAEEFAILEEARTLAGESRNGFIRAAITERIARLNAEREAQKE